MTPAALLRRQFLLAAACLPLATRASTAPAADAALDQLRKLEQALDGRLGVYARSTGSGAQLAYRADERFPMCSTFKIMAASAILARGAQEAGLLERRIAYPKTELVSYSPVTEKHVGDGMTVAELCAAALQYSDNTAANLLMKLLGGPAGVTAYARTIGDTTFQLERWETALNSAIPGDLRDTSSPAAMGRSLQRLALDDGLPPAQRAQLCDWLRGNTTGDARIRAGVPASWQVGDKTGSGDYGTANDAGVLWPPERAPIVLVIYTTGHKPDAHWRNDVIAAAAKIVAAHLG
ncbi:class A beta-lactamase [Duganella sp. FT3S]|uniref:beta-lactamase n=1 Tax=Rugamonas fusca TaxID=2758568 RepID=A0A7W2EFN9_9BURK|nr:class A beta-lactamase [Rugamonas fusca]MBA5605079.1 class A beta-lactamase [Rugamonas fusca]